MMFGNCYDKETDAGGCDPGYNSNIRALSPARPRRQKYHYQHYQTFNKQQIEQFIY